MTWLAPRLSKRIDILLPQQTAGDNGMLEETYESLRTIWAEMKPISRTSLFAAMVRGQNTDEGRETHTFRVRSCSLAGMGTEQTPAFSGAFDSIEDLHAIKSNYYLFLRSSSADKGRRFKIRGAALDEHNSEYVIIYAEEMEEVGTGWPK